MKTLKFTLNGHDYEGLILASNSFELFKNYFGKDFSYTFFDALERCSYGVDYMERAEFKIYDGRRDRRIFQGDLIAWELGSLKLKEKEEEDVDEFFHRLADSHPEITFKKNPFIIIPPQLISVIEEKKKVEKSEEKNTIKINKDGEIVW